MLEPMLGIGILGAAGIAPAAVIRPARRSPDAEVVAVASRGGAEEYARVHGIPRSHGSYAALVNDPEVDVVYNALPPSLHAEWTIAALEAGKDVLCEKPFALNAEEAERMLAAAARTGRRVIEAFHDHYHPLSVRMREIVASGVLGTLEHARARFDGENLYDPRSIRHDPTLGGGALMDLGCYPAHWLRTTFGAEPVVRSAIAVRNPLGADLEMTAELDFPDGMTATLATSMAEGVALDSSLEVRGSRGRLLVENIVFPSAGHRIVLEVDGVERESTVAGDTTYDHQLAALVAGLRSGEPLPTEGADSVHTMRLIDAIYAAAGFDRTFSDPVRKASR
jgi:predicted dehydrogenase